MNRFERNINDEVIVKLTPEGERAYTMNCLYRTELNNDSVYSFQLWQFMNIFGSVMYLGNPESYFVDGRVVFPDTNKYNDVIPMKLFVNESNRLEMVH